MMFSNSPPRIAPPSAARNSIVPSPACAEATAPGSALTATPRPSPSFSTPSILPSLALPSRALVSIVSRSPLRVTVCGAA